MNLQYVAHKCSCADLIEHVLETEGDAYLKTLDDELSYLVRHSVDIYAAMAAFVVVIVTLLWKVSPVISRYVAGDAGVHRFARILQYHTGNKKKKNL